MELPTHAGGYELVNTDKVERALVGTVAKTGALTGGVQQPDGSYDDSALLAAYDKLGGLIRTANGDRVKSGSFYDYAARAPRVKPDVKLVFNVNGRVMEVAHGDALPPIVEAARMAEELDREDMEARAEEKVAKKKKK